MNVKQLLTLLGIIIQCLACILVVLEDAQDKIDTNP